MSVTIGKPKKINLREIRYNFKSTNTKYQDWSKRRLQNQQSLTSKNRNMN